MKKRNPIATNPIMKKGGAHVKSQKAKRTKVKVKLNREYNSGLLDEINEFMDNID